MKILELLRDHPMSVSELAERLGKDKSTVYRHIKALEKAGLVEVVERIGNETLYGRVAYIFLIAVGSDKESEEFREAYLAEGIAKLVEVLERAGVKIKDRKRFEDIVKKVFEGIEDESQKILSRLTNSSFDEVTLVHLLNLLTFLHSHKYLKESKELSELLDI
ncbi:ArsR/SmtB family transcription factor [Pyrococcus abyssi]|nr:winged helix-turn-helix domain-containing protein [Pyrococcus abyssi]